MSQENFAYFPVLRMALSLSKPDIRYVGIVGIYRDLFIQKCLFVYWRSSGYGIKGLPLLMNYHRQRNQNKLITEVSSHASCYSHGCHRKAITLMFWVWKRIRHEASLWNTCQAKEDYCPAYGIHGMRGISSLDCTRFIMVSLGR